MVSFDVVLRAEGGRCILFPGPEALPDLTFLPKATIAGGFTATLLPPLVAG